MGRQVLGARWLRWIAQETGLEIVHGSANGGYVHEFTTVNHQHGRVYLKDMHCEIYEGCPHFMSCKDLFPGQ